MLLGDYNVIPEPIDAKNPQAWLGMRYSSLKRAPPYRRAACPRASRTRCARASGPGPYTFWDYQAGAWQKDDGIRIDHILAVPAGSRPDDRGGIDKHTRGWEKPSDHVPFGSNWNL